MTRNEKWLLGLGVLGLVGVVVAVNSGTANAATGPVQSLPSSGGLVGADGTPQFTDNSPATVSFYQGILQQYGYSPGLVDGVLGRNTRAAIIRFQRANHIQALPGVFDIPTRLALDELARTGGAVTPTGDDLDYFY